MSSKRGSVIDSGVSLLLLRNSLYVGFGVLGFSLFFFFKFGVLVLGLYRERKVSTFVFSVKLYSCGRLPVFVFLAVYAGLYSTQDSGIFVLLLLFTLQQQNTRRIPSICQKQI